MSRRNVYGRRAWRRVRAAVLHRDGHRCRVCGHAGRLEVHHLDPLWRSAGNPFDPARLVAICRACHFRAHGKTPAGPVAGADEWRRELSR